MAGLQQSCFTLGFGFAGAILGLAVSVRTEKGVAVAAQGFAIAFVAGVFLLLLLIASFTVFHFFDMKFREGWPTTYQRPIRLMVGLLVCGVAVTGGIAELLEEL